MVENGYLCPGGLLRDEPRGPEVHRRGGRRLGHRDRQTHRGGQGGQPRAVQVEDLGDVGSYVVSAPVAGHAEHSGQPVVAKSGQFGLQDRSVPVPAGQGHPGPRPGVGDHPRQQDRREVPAVLVIPDQNGVALGARTRAVVARVSASAGGTLRSVSTNGAAIGGRWDVGPSQNGGRLVGQERAAERPHLARQIGTYATARAEDHLFGQSVCTAPHSHEQSAHPATRTAPNL